MQIFSPQVVDGNKITVTNTSTRLFALINTAVSGSDAQLAGFPSTCNGINILCENGSVRILIGQDPTAAIGFLLQANIPYFLRNIHLSQLRLIRTGGNDVTCQIQIGVSDIGESSSMGTTIDSGHPNNTYPITANDSTDLSGTVTKGVAVDVVAGTTATIAFKLLNDTSVTTRVLSSSTYLPGRFSRIMSTGTTLNGASITGYGG